MEKEVKEDWDVVKDVAKEDWEVVKDAAKEDWEVVKEEAREDWNKFGLDWNNIPPSDSEIVPAEREEAGGAESEGKKVKVFIF